MGYAIFPPSPSGKAVRSSILAYASECWSAASAPTQLASMTAFSTTPALDEYRSTVAALHEYCTTKLYSALQRLGLLVPNPKGAFYVYPSFQPYAAQLASLHVHTSRELSQWLITECGVAALPGSAFGEDDEGPVCGRLRLRMATSYMYFDSDAERYTAGYKMLSKMTTKSEVDLPLLREAIKALEAAVRKLRDIGTAKS